MTNIEATFAAESLFAHDPATLEPLGSFPVMGPAEVQAAVARARRAQVAWGRTSFAERRAVMRTLREFVIARHETICRLAVRDSGKTMTDAALGEVFPVLEKLRYVIANGEKDLRPDKRSSGILMQKGARVEYHPLGVVGVIAPWNFPFHNLLCPTIPALFAGNGVVAKVSEHTTWSAAPYLQVIRDALVAHGHSEELVQVVTGYGATGSALVTSGVEKIFFTGSPQNGRKVMEAASRGPVDVVLELGGKDPMIVCADADLDRAARGAAWGGLINAGQMCISVERLFVVDAVYDRFVAALRREVERVKVGGPDDDADMGPITFPPQLDTIRRHLADAVERGARIVAGGDVLPQGAQFFAPTIVEDVVPGMALYDEETFGPVLPVVRVRDEDEAVRMANDHIYGLTASVWTRDIKRGTAIASRIEAGQVMINDVVVAVGNPALPFGGVKASGLGRYHGDEGLLTFTHQRAILVNRGLLPSEPFWFPYRGKYGTMRTMFRQLLDGRMAAATTSLVRLLRDGRAARNGEE